MKGRKLKAIVAVDKNWGIGKDGGLLCHIPGDLAYFKEKTKGAAVVMGRKTLESLPGGKPLPGRRNIVLTRNKDYEKEGVETVSGTDELVELLADGADDAFVIGGAEVYAMLLPFTDEVLVTKMESAFDANKFFPDLDQMEEFELASESRPVTENGITYRFTVYRRRDAQEEA